MINGLITNFNFLRHNSIYLSINYYIKIYLADSLKLQIISK